MLCSRVTFWFGRVQLLSGIDVSDAVQVNNPEANFPTTTLADAPSKKKNAQVISSQKLFRLHDTSQALLTRHRVQVSLSRVVAAMTKKVKSLQRDLEKEEAVFKTHAHRVVRYMFIGAIWLSQAIPMATGRRNLRGSRTRYNQQFCLYDLPCKAPARGQVGTRECFYSVMFVHPLQAS